MSLITKPTQTADAVPVTIARRPLTGHQLWINFSSRQRNIHTDFNDDSNNNAADTLTSDIVSELFRKLTPSGLLKPAS